MHELNEAGELDVFAWQWWRLGWVSPWARGLWRMRDEQGEWQQVCGRLVVLVRRSA